jgi:ATP-dependent DNA helicase PIF1
VVSSSLFAETFFNFPLVTTYNKVTKGTPFYAFQSDAWKSLNLHLIELRHVYRQSDPVFVKILNEMRRGEVTAESERTLKALSRPAPLADKGVEATHLYPMRHEVDRLNDLKLNNLKGDVYTFRISYLY